MISRTLVTTLGAAALAALPAAARPAEKLDGKKIFLDQKCNMCHTVSTAGVQATSKIKAPDLTGLAKRDATLLSRYLRRDADINAKKHVKPFTGSDEQLGALIAWLQEQTPPEKK